MKVLREMEVEKGKKMLVIEVNGEVELRVKKVRRKESCCGNRLGKNEKVCESCKKRLEKRIEGVKVIFGD